MLYPTQTETRTERSAATLRPLVPSGGLGHCHACCILRPLRHRGRKAQGGRHRTCYAVVLLNLVQLAREGVERLLTNDRLDLVLRGLLLHVGHSRSWVGHHAVSTP